MLAALFQRIRQRGYQSERQPAQEAGRLCFESLEPRRMLAYDVVGFDPTVDPTTLTIEANSNVSAAVIGVTDGQLTLDGAVVAGADLASLTTIRIDTNGFSDSTVTLDNTGGALGGLNIVYDGGVGAANSLQVIGSAELADAFSLDVASATGGQLSLESGDAAALVVDISNLSGSLTLDGGAGGTDSAVITGSAGADRLAINTTINQGLSISLSGVENATVDVTAGGNDVVHVQPSLAAAIQVTGDVGDRLLVETAAGRIAQQVTIDADSIEVVGEGSVDYSGIGHLAVRTFGGDDVVVVDAATAAALDVDVRAGAGEDLVMVRGTAGNDVMVIVDNVVSVGGLTVTVEGTEFIGLDGRAGDDQLAGSVGTDLLIGGDGNDFLRGGGGADILIGGKGMDVLFGEGGNDLLIGGETAFDAHAAALLQVMQEWDSPLPAHVRIKNFLNWDDQLLSRRTILDDGALDVLYGAAGADLYASGKLDAVVGFTGGVDAKVKVKGRK